MASIVTLNTVQRAFISTHEGQRFSAGADYRTRQNRNPIAHFFNWLCEKVPFAHFKDNTIKEIEGKTISLNAGVSDTAQAILKAQTNAAGGLERPCEFTIEEQQCQLTSKNGRFILVDKQNPRETRELPDTTLANIKRVMLIEYLCSERDKGNNAIDLSEFDLTGVNLKGVDLTGVSEKSRERLSANFQDDVLAMLTVYAKTVTELIPLSSTRDQENGDEKLAKEHDKAIDSYRAKNALASPGLIRAAITTRTGNCGECAQLGKAMCDVYLTPAMNDLGHDDFSIKSSVVSQQGVDHAAVSLECTLYGVTKRVVLDPWEGGRAFTAQDALPFYCDGAPPIGTSLDTLFKPWPANHVLESNREKIKEVFGKTGVNTKLNTNLKANALKFKGASISG